MTITEAPREEKPGLGRPPMAGAPGAGGGGVRGARAPTGAPRGERPGRGRPPMAEPLVTEAEAFRALVIGTRDYVRKNGFEKVVVGLSGGVDSSLVAAVAADALRPENVIGVSMPSRYSSPGSKSDAKALARNLGIEFKVISIEKTFSAYLETLAEPLKDTKTQG